MIDYDFTLPHYDLAFHIFCSEKWDDEVDDICREREAVDENYYDRDDCGEVEPEYLIMRLRRKWNNIPKSQKDEYYYKGRYQRWAQEEDNKLKKNSLIEAMNSASHIPRLEPILSQPTPKHSRRPSRQSSPPHQY
jgi:hypothetical protein